MREKHYEPGNSLQKDIQVSLTGAGHVDDAKTAQLEIAECFIGTELPKLMKTRAGAQGDEFGRLGPSGAERSDPSKQQVRPHVEQSNQPDLCSPFSYAARAETQIRNILNNRN
jgi:hypothetical protein